MTATKTIATTELQVGNIVRFYGARFEIYSAAMYPDNTPGNSGPVMVAMGKWLDGRVETGYFGPTKDWNFQGNRLASVCVEVNE